MARIAATVPVALTSMAILKLGSLRDSANRKVVSETAMMMRKKAIVFGLGSVNGHLPASATDLPASKLADISSCGPPSKRNSQPKPNRFHGIKSYHLFADVGELCEMSGALGNPCFLNPLPRMLCPKTAHIGRR